MTIFVLGMHRSGTSAITGLIAAMGAYAGPKALMLPAIPDNPRGFFERRDVLVINQMILAAQQCNWHEMAHFNSHQPISSDIRDRIRACLAEMESHAPYVVKDPRFCLTLPYWCAALPKPPTIVLALRHPAAIADSLRLRNNMPPNIGLALWESYMAQALYHVHSLPVVHTAFEQFIIQPKRAIGALHHALTLRFPTLTLPNVQIVEPSLARANPRGIKLTPSQEMLFTKLRAV